MDATYQTLMAAADLGEFTVAVLAAQADVKPVTVRTVLNRHRHLFEQSSPGSGRRGGQPRVWRVKATARGELEAIIAAIADRFDEDQYRLLPVNPELATAEDLEAFAPHLAAREVLPHLVRRLLVATPGVTHVSVAAGDGIGAPGFDGRVNAASASPFVPEGFSVWELGTSVDPRGTAQDDFQRRTRNPRDVDPTAATYVAVSMRRFPGKDEWVSDAHGKGPWRDVKVLHADDLYAWLEQAPEVHVWVSEQLGLRPLDVASLERWWESWLRQTSPPTPGDLVLAGRRDAARELRRALQPDGQVVGVSADSRQEALAFLAAALLIDDPDDGFSAAIDPMSNAVVVDSDRAWSRLAGTGRRAVLIPRFDDPDIAIAIRNGHRVIVLMGASDDRSRAHVQLAPIGREEAREVLRRVHSSLDLGDADLRAAHARRSLISYRRAHAINPAYKRPAWAERGNADIWAPLVLVGSWEAEAEADQEVVADIAGRSYGEIERELELSADPEDPPFVRAGNRWQLTSPVDAWTLLRSSISRDALKRWRSRAKVVLSEKNPADELPPEDRIFAAARGIHRKYSSTLRSGLGRSAALVASASATGERARDGQPWTEHAADLVTDLLGHSPDARSWSGLEDVLPALAEAAPEVFLRAAASGLEGAEPPLEALFTDNHTIAWATQSAHTGLLWALELLSWSDDHVAEACDTLAGLAEIDPGGRLANRPAESLRRVLLPWHPQTAASLDDRLIIVEGILERHRNVGWQLILGLLPHPHDTSHPTYRPMFRDWKSLAPQATFSDRLEATRRLVQLVLTHLDRAPEVWPTFIDLLPNLPPDELSRCLEVLRQTDVESFTADVRLSTWQALTTLIAAHRRSSTARWALADETLRRFEQVAAVWEPQDSPERHARLFGWHPDLPGVDMLDHTAYEDKLAEARRAAVASILQSSGDEGLTRLIKEAPVPGFIGVAVAETQRDKATDPMLARLSASEPERLAAYGWIARMTQLGGSDWVASMLRRASELPDQARTHVYLALPNEPGTWAIVDGDAASVANQFWQSVGPLTASSEHAVEFAEKLIDRHRPWSAAVLLALHSQREGSKIPLTLIERTLRAAASPGNEEPLPPGSLGYDIGVLLDRFEAAGGSPDALVEFEYIYFEVLQHTRKPRALFNALATQPELFVDLVSAAFRRANEPATNDPSPSEAARALQAFAILREWQRPPGLKDDATVDGDVLQKWVTKVRRMLKEADRASVGDECIGEVLSGSPSGTDGIWPAEPIRQLMEDLKSESMDRGLAIGKQNARGIISRGVFDGGRQEDALADQYESWSKQVMTRWPRAGRLLREMARSYRKWARREDAESEEWANRD
jgi:hypothetical protein